MKDHLTNLCQLIDEYLTNNANLKDIENLTFEIISEDDFDNLDEGVKDAIYILDNNELNQLTENDFKETESKIKSFLNTQIKF